MNLSRFARLTLICVGSILSIGGCAQDGDEENQRSASNEKGDGEAVIASSDATGDPSSFEMDKDYAASDEQADSPSGSEGFALANAVSFTFVNSTGADLYLAFGGAPKINGSVASFAKGWAVIKSGASYRFDQANADSFGTNFYFHGRNAGGTKTWGSATASLCAKSTTFNWNSSFVNGAGCPAGGTRVKANATPILTGNRSYSFTFLK